MESFIKNNNELEKIYILNYLTKQYQTKQFLRKIFNFKFKYLKKPFLYLKYFNTDTYNAYIEYNKILLKERNQNKNILCYIEEKDKDLFNEINEIINREKNKIILNFEDFLILDGLKNNKKLDFRFYFNRERKLTDEKMREFCSRIVLQHQNKDLEIKKQRKVKSSREDTINLDSGIRVFEL